MQIQNAYLTHNRPKTHRSRTTAIAVHWVANPNSTAMANRNYFNTTSRAVSSNYIIGLQGEILCCIPDEETSWCTNEANSYTVSVECCHPDWTGCFTGKTYTSLVELTARLCQKYHLDPQNGGVIRHYDVTRKICPKWFVPASRGGSDTNGERTGNVDIVTLALNMYSQGVDPELDFSNMPEIVEVYERVTRMHVYERSPYSGQLVFAAFSGSHQDAIAKGMHWREEHDCKHWNVPYLPINPEDVGRVYEADVIRINSQSGKGGVSYLMETKYGYHIPQKMRESFGYLVKGVSDHAHKELLPEEVLDIFTKHYVNVETPVSIPEVHFVQKGENAIGTEATISYKGSTETVHGDGNGRLDAVSNAVKAHLNMDFSLTTYTEHALEVCSNSKAVAYVGLEKNGKTYWGVGVHSDIINSSISAFLSALNAMLMDLKK